jgi:hypothetical protein
LLVVVAFAETVAKVSLNNFRFPVDSEIPVHASLLQPPQLQAAASITAAACKRGNGGKGLSLVTFGLRGSLQRKANATLNTYLVRPTSQLRASGWVLQLCEDTSSFSLQS